MPQGILHDVCSCSLCTGVAQVGVGPYPISLLGAIFCTMSDHAHSLSFGSSLQMFLARKENNWNTWEHLLS